MYPHLDTFLGDRLGIQLPFRFHSFGVMIALAIAVAAWLCKREFDRMHAARLLEGVAGTGSGARAGAGPADASPSQLIPNMVLIVVGAAIAGGIQPWAPVVAGYKFGPLGTFYGGLICASVAVSLYVWKKGLSLPRVVDAVAPGLMLAYALGRVGCYLAGDGDWGRCSSLADKPGWVPAHLWSETFPRNILGVDAIAYTAEMLQRSALPAGDCIGADGVFPTMLYEAAIATALFALLWCARKHPFKAGWLFSLYVVLNGMERFLIENIRINQRHFFALSQAQLIALGLIVLGALGLGLTMRRGRSQNLSVSATP